jgi:hypothetical protein
MATLNAVVPAVSNEALAQDIEFFFEVRTALKLYHWSTSTYAQHKATDEAIEALDELVDKYVEVYLSMLDRPYLAAFDASRKRAPVMRLRIPANIVEFLQSAKLYLIENIGAGTSLALLNIRDDMLVVVNQLMYLLTFV